jgi:hypothetical protein
MNKEIHILDHWLQMCDFMVNILCLLNKFVVSLVKIKNMVDSRPLSEVVLDIILIEL